MLEQFSSVNHHGVDGLAVQGRTDMTSHKLYKK